VVAPLILLLCVAAFAAGYAVAARRSRTDIPATPEIVPPASLDDAPESEPARVAYVSQPPEGSPEWQQAMADLGERMRLSGVKVAVFVHGSFVGDDPLALAHVLEDTFPLLPDVARRLRGLTRAQVSRFLGDLSNFTREYVECFSRATGVDAFELTWSGENHHAARIQGAVRLARALALHRGGALRPGDRVLVVGHSHGGQVVAVLSQLLARAHGYEELVSAAQARGEDIGALQEHLALLRRCALDVVTLGTPVRYGWARGARLRLLHVVNHRGGARAPSLRGWLHTRHGDYVRQLGVHGSDFPAVTATERQRNARLDRLLGPGASLRALLHHVARSVRAAPQGMTVLVDYGDRARVVPNFLATGLGHSAYTRRDAMLFHAHLVASHFYPPAGAGGPPALLVGPRS